MTPRALAFSAVGFSAAIALAAVGACSLIVDRQSTQCQSDADCASFPSAACNLATHACVPAGCAANDCVCSPMTPADILNACPRGECVTFDASRVTTLVDGKLPPPPSGAVTPLAPSFSCGSGAGGGSSGTGGGDAGATPVCEEQESPLFLFGPTSIQPLLGWVAKLYAQEHTTVVFQGEPSCVGVERTFNGGFMDNSAGNAAYTSYYDAEGAQHTCAIVSGKVPIHVAISDVFPETCGYNLNDTDPNVVDSPGPVQAMGFIVPKASIQTSIDAAAAYMVFGFGNASKVSPWTDERYILERDGSSGTQNMIATSLGLDPNKLRGTVAPGSPALAALVGCSPNPQATIGLLAVDLAESGAYPVKLLSYQHFDQTCGYLPDSSPTSNDKRNVRDGHYFVWGPVHLLTRKDQPNANASQMINYVSGVSPPPANQPDIFQVWSDAHLVPQCAMRVTRSSDGGPLSPVSPAASCYCRYDEATLGSSTCTKCHTSADCTDVSSPVCSPYGYCEPS